MAIIQRCHLFCHVEHLGVVQASITAKHNEGIPPIDHASACAISIGYGWPYRPGFVRKAQNLIAVAKHVELVLIYLSRNPEKQQSLSLLSLPLLLNLELAKHDDQLSGHCNKT